MEKLKEMAIGAISSKKFWAMISAVGTALANDTVPGIAMSPMTTGLIIAALSAYMVGQGIADNGKEKAKIETEAQAALAAPAGKGKTKKSKTKK